MPDQKLPGGPTQDEIMAVSLAKMGVRSTDTVLEIGCGTGKVSVAMAQRAKKVYSVDIRPEAVALATETARKAGVHNIEFSHAEATAFLHSERIYDCAFLGGTKNLLAILPSLSKNVRRTIVINAVLLSTVSDAVNALQELGLFCEVVQVQVSRSHAIAGSIMFKPIDPVYIIVGRGAACS
ncbi:precorrin-6Y C5,15-methyltransferase (decarboxylating) subunit CbiT [Methanoregula sp.]|uniref:bifunctional cobalt-precorrin-7 (C(5))-methyltransferase/cobalt-precorrin-6B (C(15))-methyltransferase n=1 Tax=Methanoregula sp. TaxID=2052170 RepID=UPI003568479D